MKQIFLLLLLFCGAMSAKAQSTNLIPAPVEYSVRSGSVSSDGMIGLREKVRISEKALLRRLEGKKLADWQLKSAYWLELGKKGVKIVAADEEGVFYARQTLKMMASLDSSVSCCTILDWPREPPFPGQGLREEAVGDDGPPEDEPLPFPSRR